MAEFNSCAKIVNTTALSIAHSEYRERTTGTGYAASPTQHMLTMQNDLQKVYTAKHGRCPTPDEIVTKGQLIDFLKDQKEAFDDEFRELIEAIHGMSRPAEMRSVGWKKWKGKYDELRAEGVDENLTDDDIVERNFEFVDMHHFYMNMQLALKLSEEDVFVGYLMKNKENHDRQVKGY